MEKRTATLDHVQSLITGPGDAYRNGGFAPAGQLCILTKSWKRHTLHIYDLGSGVRMCVICYVYPAIYDPNGS